MHRVELKVVQDYIIVCIHIRLFLMHRVELKVEWFVEAFEDSLVPNAPCGVESGDFHPEGVPYHRS